MSSTPTQQSKGDGFSDATATAREYVDRIGLRSVLEDGVVGLLETDPLPASALAAWLVLATKVTRVLKTRGHGQSNDAVASAMLAGFESLVRAGKSGGEGEERGGAGSDGVVVWMYEGGRV